MNSINHVAIIMDGNGRWGKIKKNNRNFGHNQGLKVIEKIVQQSIVLDIPILTLFTFSSENWNRPKKEINFLFNLLKKFLNDKIEQLHKDNICLKFIGNKNKLSKDLLKKIKFSENLTRSNNKLTINIAINYGSKDEIINAAKIINKKNLYFTKKNFEKNFYTKDIPEPDILIRTGNTHRLSNFLLWQLAYTEIFFEKKLWPDFNVKDFNRIMNKFKKTKRNFGAISDE
jgi:undecaprenyl diphosphate synthase